MAVSSLVAASGAKSQYFQEFTSTSSWTAPTGVTTIECLLVAGGGGSGSRGNNAASTVTGGGGGGQVVKTYLTVSPGTSYTVTIGAGGTAGVNTGTGTAGGNGGNSSFGSLLTCGGGGGSPVLGNGVAGNSGTNAIGGGFNGGGAVNSSGTRYAGGYSTVSSGSGSGASIDEGSARGYSGGGGGAGGPGFTPEWRTDAGQYLPSLGGPGLFGFGVGGSVTNYSGVQPQNGRPNTGQGAYGANGGSSPVAGAVGGSGYCLISWWA